MNRIEEIIEEKGYNMTDFAKKMGMSRQNLYKILKSPSYPTLENIAKALEVPIWQLFASQKEVQEPHSIYCPYCQRKINFSKDTLQVPEDLDKETGLKAISTEQ